MQLRFFFVHHGELLYLLHPYQLYLLFEQQRLRILPARLLSHPRSLRAVQRRQLHQLRRHQLLLPMFLKLLLCEWQLRPLQEPLLQLQLARTMSDLCESFQSQC